MRPMVRTRTMMGITRRRMRMGLRAGRRWARGG